MTASVGLVLVAPGAAAGGGGCHEPVGVEQETTTVVMVGMCLRPGTVRVHVGDTVTVRNTDPVLHNLYGADGWFHGDLASGEEATHTFERPGTYAYACTLHPGMVGSVIVEDPELVASTSPAADDGARDTAMAAILGGITAAAGGFAAGRVTRRRPSSAAL